jgi:hypothetical protein
MAEETEVPVWRLGRWRSRGTDMEVSGGALGPRPTVGRVVEESGLIGGGGHVDLDDQVREERSEWGRYRARGFN